MHTYNTDVFIYTCSTRTPDYRWQGQMKISENPCFMYGQNFKKFPKKCSDWTRHALKKPICSDCPSGPQSAKFEVRTGQSGLKNHQICSDWPDYQALKNAKFVRIGPKITIFARLSLSTQTNYVIIHSPFVRQDIFCQQ